MAIARDIGRAFHHRYIIMVLASKVSKTSVSWTTISYKVPIPVGDLAADRYGFVYNWFTCQVELIIFIYIFLNVFFTFFHAIFVFI